jgi:DNA-damage-inducible protein J
MMATNSVVRARIDGRLKTEAEAVLASIGLTTSDAFRLMMKRIAREKKLSFEPLVNSPDGTLTRKIKQLLLHTRNPT